MTIDRVAPYVAMDRRQAAIRSGHVDDQQSGALLLADVSGFTSLTEALAKSLGPRQGAEELTKLLNAVYTALVSRVHHFGGSIVCFIGDALVACFPDDDGERAVACGLQMQRAMKQYQTIRLPRGGRVSLAMKAAVTLGPYRRLLVGDPSLRRIDVLAGETVERLADVEHVAEPGDVLVAAEVEAQLAAKAVIRERRSRFGVVEGLLRAATPRDWPELEEGSVDPEVLRSYLLPEVYERIVLGQGDFIAELRPISALFLRFTGIDYDRDADAGVKLDAFAGWVQSIVHRLGGHVLLLTTADKGSHLYAVFGALAAHEDDCARAVAAATALLEVPETLSFVSGVQVGVSYGRARVGAYGGLGRRTYGALGDVINLAARLMGIAPPGEVRCDANIVDRTRDVWTYEDLPPVELKGMQEAHAVYRPLARRGAVQSNQRRPMVGRTKELQTLLDALETSRSGRRQLCFIEGEAGIGKSRLIEELLASARASGARCLLGAGDGIEQHAAYYAWRDVLQQAFGLRESMPRSERRQLTHTRLAEIGPSAATRAPLLNSILGLEFPETAATEGLAPEIRQESLTALVGELLVHEASIQPLVLILDDVHWLDSLSWDLVLSTARLLARQPVLILLTHRPFGDVEPAAAGTLLGVRDAQRVELGELPVEAMAALAANQLGVHETALPDLIRELLEERSGGNPFFVRELIGSLQDAGRLRIESGRCVLDGEAGAIREEVPETLEGIVLSRLDRLPGDEQLTLRAASVIGRSFLVRTLCAMHPSEPPVATLLAHLDHTTRRRLTMLEAEDPEPEYAFQHIVTQQVTYGTLLYEQRRALHGRIADWIENAFADELEPQYSLLAFHWRRAGRAANEARYCRLAGRQAAANYANAEAVLYFDRALELLDQLDEGADLERRYDILKCRAKAHAFLGHVEQERTDLEALLRIAERSEDKTKRGRILVDWADLHNRCGQLDQALECSRAAVTSLAETDDQDGVALAIAQIGRTYEEQGEFAEARDYAQRALEIFEKTGNAHEQAGCVKSLGVIHARLGELQEAMGRFREASDLYRALNDRKGEADILGNLGALSYYLGDYEATIRHSEQAQPMFEEMGNQSGSARCLSNLGNSYSALGSFEDALTCQERSLEIYERLDDPSSCADAHTNIGNALHALGVGGYPELKLEVSSGHELLEQAFDCHMKALEIHTRIGNRAGEVMAHLNLGSVCSSMGSLERAEGHLDNAVELIPQLGLEVYLPRALAAQARVALQRDESERALRLSAEGVQLLGEQEFLAEEINFTRYLALTKAGQAVEAQVYLEKAYSSVIAQAKSIAEPRLRASFRGMFAEVVAAAEQGS